MYTVPTGGILECQLRGRLDGQETRNVFHYRAGEDIVDGGGALTTIVGDFDQLVCTPIADGMSSDWEYLRAHAQWVYPLRYVGLEIFCQNIAGGQTGPACPSGVSCVVKRRTELSGRRYRGRVYLPGIRKADVLESQNLGSWWVNNHAQIEGAVNTSLPYSLISTLQPVIWSYAAPGRQTIILAAELDRILRYQRRREVGKGI